MARKLVFSFLASLLVVCGISSLALAQQFSSQDLSVLQNRLKTNPENDVQTIPPVVGKNALGQTSPQTMSTPIPKKVDDDEPLSLIERTYTQRLDDSSDSTRPQRPDESSAKIDPRTGSPAPEDKSPQVFKIINSKDQVRQIGYDALQNRNLPFDSQNELVGGIADNYVLGIGDTISVTLRGQSNATYRVEVDRNGRVTLPSLPPVAAAGRTFGEFRSDLQQQISDTMLQTHSFIALQSLRQRTVTVSGEVKQPGTITVSGLGTVIDALTKAGGIRKTGSLRKVTLIHDGKHRVIDLYPVLLGGDASTNLTLQDGDRLVVPPIGPTVAVLGNVSRPGIYELSSGSISAQNILYWAGNTLTSSGNRLLRNTIDANGRAKLVDMSNNRKGTLSRGDILLVQRKSAGVSSAVELVGAFAHPGWQSLTKYPTLGALLHNRALLADSPYLPFVVIQRQDPASLATYFIGVDAVKVLTGGHDFALQDQDRVIILNPKDLRYLTSDPVLSVVSKSSPSAPLLLKRSKMADRVMLASVSSNKDTAAALLKKDDASELADNEKNKDNGALPLLNTPAAENCAALEDLSRTLSENLAMMSLPVSAQDPSDADNSRSQTCPKLFNKYQNLLTFVLEHVVSLHGAVQRPGFYPVVDGAALSNVLLAAGNTLNNADPSDIRVTNTYKQSYVRQKISLNTARTGYQIAPYSDVMVGAKFTPLDGSVIMVQGEVRHPGRYVLFRGERLSQVLERAGGLTDQAYVPGAIFTRASVRQEEEQNYQRVADEIEQAMPSAILELGAQDNAQISSAMQALQSMVVSMRLAKAAGRIVINANPAALTADPQNDIVLQGGDRLYIPKRPSHIMVTGEVMHTGALQFKSGQPADQYLKQAGGVTSNADESRIFVILPNGEARHLNSSFWDYKEQTLPPGSTIVVPRDLSPIMLWSVTKDALSIFSNMAISVAALATINDD